MEFTDEVLIKLSEGHTLVICSYCGEIYTTVNKATGKDCTNGVCVDMYKTSGCPSCGDDWAMEVVTSKNVFETTNALDE